MVRFLAKRLPDKRDGRRIRHSQKRLARTLLLLTGQVRREHSDVHAAAGRSGAAACHRRPFGHGSAAQGRAPALAADAVAAGGGLVGEGGRCGRLREGLQRLAGWRLKAMDQKRRPTPLVMDVDSLPDVGSRPTAVQRVERLL